jgi:hypothetical protein
MKLLVRRRPATVSNDRVKPAYILNGIDRGNNTFRPPVDATLDVAPPATQPQPTTRTTRSVRHILYPLASTSEQPSPRGRG